MWLNVFMFHCDSIHATLVLQLFEAFNFSASLANRISSMSYLTDEYNLHNIFVKWEPALRFPSPCAHNASWPGKLKKKLNKLYQAFIMQSFMFLTDDSFPKVSLNCSLDENEWNSHTHTITQCTPFSKLVFYFEFL